jgi:hypothetical protein
MKTKNILCSLLVILLCGCSLDYENTAVINPENVWKDKTMINAFLTDIYGRMMPGWPINANNTDEGMNGVGDMSSYARGLITIDNCAVSPSYGNIDRINFFLDQLETVTVLTDEEKKQLRGQALFWRAWDYWGKVFSIGGVPLILHFQDVTNIESLFVTRNSTSECVTQIIADLDEAIADLPDQWTGSDYGRIDKGCAMAFKGRVLLQYASPLFNRNNDQSRWQTAYDANKAAVEFLESVGKGLYQGDFADIWYDEQNCEVIMVNQFYYPDHAFDQKNIRPGALTKDNADYNQAIFPLLMAYPKKDGTKLEVNLDSLASDEAYNDQFLTDFYMDRDPRFYATIFCPGTEYPGADNILPGDLPFWDTRQLEQDASGNYVYTSMVVDQLGVGGTNSSGYYQKKGLDELTTTEVYNAETDWIEIRFAEVLMNYGECANEIGKTDEALQVLYDIRERAGIEGDSNYGITASTQDEIREAYINERFIEFAYEGKRFSDLRRWMRYDILNDLKYRSSLFPVLKNNDDIENFDFTKYMYDSDVRKLFRFDYIECVDMDTQYMFNLDTNHWFYSIAKNVIDRNSKFEQNNEWGGTFDPLK